MNRRHFIKLIGASAALGLSQGCVHSEGLLLDHHDHDDIRLQVLSYAVLAANAHNIQPWKIRFTGDLSMELYVDPERLLPETDPPARQIHISQGTFLENLHLAATKLGYQARINYFPHGMYGNEVVEELPVATIELSPSNSRTEVPLFSQIQRRLSNKRIYSDTPIPESALAGLQQLKPPGGMTFNVETRPDRVAQIARFCATAMAIENQNRARELETIHMFRFNTREARQSRDGLTVAQTGKQGFSKWLVENFFLSRQAAEHDPAQFSQFGTRLAHAQATSAQAFAWISTERNRRLDQVKCGRFYQRLHLTTTSLDIAQHPMSQLLQEYPDMASLQQEFLGFLAPPHGHTVQMLVRLGMAKPVPQTLRRDVNTLLWRGPNLSSGKS